MSWLFRVLGRLPLWLNQCLGFALGWMVWWLSPRHRRLTSENIQQYARHMKLNDCKHLLRSAIGEQGRGITALAIAWTAPPERLYRLVRACIGWEHIEAATANARPIILLPPLLRARKSARTPPASADAVVLPARTRPFCMMASSHACLGGL